MHKQRWNPSLTPPSWGWAAALASLLWLSFLASELIEKQIHSEMYHMSIGTVLSLWIGLSALVVPVIGGTIALIAGKYLGSVSLWYWNTARPWRSSIWTLSTAWLAYVSFDLFHNLYTFSGCGWLSQMLWGEFLYVLLVLRAVLVARRH